MVQPTKIAVQVNSGYALCRIGMESIPGWRWSASPINPLLSRLWKLWDRVWCWPARRKRPARRTLVGSTAVEPERIEGPIYIPEDLGDDYGYSGSQDHRF